MNKTALKRWARAGLWLVLSAVPVAAAAQIELPDLGDPAESALPLAREKELGEQIMRQIRARRVIVDDLIVQEYISALGYQLLEHAQDAPLHDFAFFVLGDKAINAFALPGGYLGFNAGLITATENESELAAVMAHEISHVTQRHLARAFAKQGELAIPIMAGIITAVLLGGEVAEAAIAAAGAGSMQAQINYTREHEYEADRIGIDLLGRAGYDINGMATLFEKMQRQAKLRGGSPPEYLSTHPVHSKRIAEAQDRAARHPAPTKTADSMQYHLIKARLRVLTSDNPRAAADDLALAVKDSGGGGDGDAETAAAQAMRYGLVFALLEGGRLDEAAREARMFDKALAANRYFTLLSAEVDLRRGLDDQALAEVAGLRKRHPDDHVLTMTYARMLIEAERAADAAGLLEDYLVYRPGDPAIYALLSRAAVVAGDEAGSHAYIAEYHRIYHDLDKAVFHLEAALKEADAGDAYRKSRLQAQLDAVRAQRGDKPPKRPE